MKDYRFAIGIDPSLDGCGYAVLDLNYKTPRLVEKGVIKGRTKTWGDTSRGVKLKLIQAELSRLRAKYQPLYPVVFLEQGFAKFKKETQALYRARGVIELVFWDMDIKEYAPSTVKRIVTGNGNASKELLADRIGTFYNVDSFETDDESDALGVVHTGYLEYIKED